MHNTHAASPDASPGLCSSRARVGRYRNLVMQRVFEGRTKQELVAEALSRHRFQQAHAVSAAAVATYGKGVPEGTAGGGVRVTDLRPAGELLEGAAAVGDTEVLPDAPPLPGDATTPPRD